MLRDDPTQAGRAQDFAAKVSDASELVHRLGPAAVRHPLPLVAAYHDPCHLAHGQRIRAAPGEALRAIPGLTLREIREPEICCGSAGIYNLIEPEPAAWLGKRKTLNVLETGAELLVTGNAGRLLQIRASLDRMRNQLPLAHPMQVFDAALSGDPVTTLTR